MTEKSQFWYTDGFTGATGDGSAPYTQEEFRAHNAALYGEGVIVPSGAENLAVSGTASPLSVAMGRAQVAGFHYWNDATKTLTVVTPLVGTTGGRVVLRADWATAAVRLAVIMSSDGSAAIPALTQVLGTTYEISLASFEITTGGVVTLTSTRVWAATALATPDGERLDHTSDGLLTIAAGGVQTVHLDDESVDDTKVGNRVPNFYRRQGGDASIWDTAGTTDYTPTTVMMQGGRVSMTGSATSGDQYVDFPEEFSQAPLVLVTPIDSAGTLRTTCTVSKDRVRIYWYSSASEAAGKPEFSWLAIGPEY